MKYILMNLHRLFPKRATTVPRYFYEGGIAIKQSFHLMLSVAGTIIGAGFATGKELQLFFKSPDLSSLMWLSVSLLLMTIVSLLYWNRQKEANTPSEPNRWLRLLFFLFSAASCSVMFACGGESLQESIQIPCSLGILITYSISLLIVTFGIEGVYRFNLVATPILILSMILISFASLLLPVGLFQKEASSCANMLTYTGYNLLSVLPFLSALPKTTDIKNGRYGIIAGFLLVAVSGLLLKTVLNLHAEVLSDEPIPMLKIMGLLSPRLSYLYTIMLYGSILTTAINCLYALTKGNHLICSSVLLLGMSFLGFSTLLENLYSLFGYFGIGVIGFTLWNSMSPLRERKDF